MTRGRWFLFATALLLFLGWYVSVGVGYERLQQACFDSRHSIDQEGYVGGGIGVVMWPLFLPVTPEQSCSPAPQG